MSDFKPGDSCEVYSATRWDQRWVPATFVEEKNGICFVEVKVSETISEVWSGTSNFLRKP